MADLADLSTFITVVRAGSFAGAARRLGLSPAMVGRRVQDLEERHHARLIERTTRSLRLTDLGQRFLEGALRVVEAAEDLDDLARPDGTALAGRVRLTGPTTLGIKRLAGIVTRLSGRHPGLAVEMTLGDRTVEMVSEGFDVAVRIGELRPSGLIARRVGTYRFACCASPSHLARHGTPQAPADLARAACILNLNLRPRDRWPFHDAAGAPFTVPVRGPIEIDNGEALRAAALTGAGFIYAPLDLVEDDLASGALVRVLEGWRMMELPIHVVHPSRRLVPRRVAALIEAIADGLREEPQPPR